MIKIHIADKADEKKQVCVHCGEELWNADKHIYGAYETGQEIWQNNFPDEFPGDKNKTIRCDGKPHDEEKESELVKKLKGN